MRHAPAGSSDVVVRELEARAGRLRPARWMGYRREDVDAFVGRAIAALGAAIARNDAGRAGPPPPAGRWADSEDRGTLSAWDIQDVVFRTARFNRAYDMRSVDELLDEITDALAAVTPDRRTPAPTPEPDDGGLGFT